MVEARTRCFVAVFCGRNQQSAESSFVLSGGLHSRAYHESGRSGFRAMGTLYSTALVTLGSRSFVLRKFSGQLNRALTGKVTVTPGFVGALILVLICLQGSPRNAPASTSPSGSKEISNEWVLSWSDEFDGLDGSPPDPAKWTVMGGGGGWGNNELQYYTANSRNVRQEDGKLVIEARKENFRGQTAFVAATPPRDSRH